MCFLCYVPTTLSSPQFEDPVLSDLHIKGKGRLAAPGRGAGSGVLVVIATPPGAPAKQRQALLASAVDTLQKEPWPERLVIKTKSTPPYHEGDPLPRFK